MPNFCRNDELSSSLSLVGYLLTDTELFILFAQNSQILLKFFVIPNFLTLVYLINKLKYMGFTYNGAKLFNMLPPQMRETEESNTFKTLMNNWIWENIPSY